MFEMIRAYEAYSIATTESLCTMYGELFSDTRMCMCEILIQTLQIMRPDATLQEIMKSFFGSQSYTKSGLCLFSKRTSRCATNGDHNHYCFMFEYFFYFSTVLNFILVINYSNYFDNFIAFK